MTIGDEKVVSSAELNALPDKIRRYIHDLETEADPAGTMSQSRIRSLERPLVAKAVPARSVLCFRPCRSCGP